jgi:hypothetical protein
VAFLQIQDVKQRSVVFASHPVSAKRCRMTGSAKQSILPLVEAWIASSLTLLAMTGRDF